MGTSDSLQNSSDVVSHNVNITINHASNSNTDNFFDLTASDMVLSIFLFVIAGFAEIGGGYLVWIGIRNKYYPAITITFGSLILILYGIIPTFQPVGSFGRIFAVYGGVFVVMSYLWGYLVDGLILDLGDYIGAAVALAGVCIAWFWPR